MYMLDLLPVVESLCMFLSSCIVIMNTVYDHPRFILSQQQSWKYYFGIYKVLVQYCKCSFPLIGFVVSDFIDSRDEYCTVPVWYFSVFLVSSLSTDM